MNFDKIRTKIDVFLTDLGMKKIYYTKDIIPKMFPCAIVSLISCKGLNTTTKRATQEAYTFEVYLVLDSNNIDDTTSILMATSKDFKQLYETTFCKPFKEMEFYSARADAGRKVSILKTTLEVSL